MASVSTSTVGAAIWASGRAALLPGSALARMQARVATEEVLKRWPDWEVDYGNAAKAHTPARCAAGSTLPGHGRVRRRGRPRRGDWCPARMQLRGACSPDSRRMFSGTHPMPITDRASISLEGLSMRERHLTETASVRSVFICRSRVANSQPGFGVSGGDCRIQAS